MLSKDVLVVSVAAGVTIATMEAAAAPACRWSASCPTRRAWWAASPRGWPRGRTATSHTETVSKLFNAIGKIHEVKESLLNAVTGVSGSGPAYIFQVIEAMSDGGVLAGLPRNIATDLAAQTVMGAAKMVLRASTPACSRTASRRRAAPPSRRCAPLRKNGVRAAFIGAVRAAADRGEELGETARWRARARVDGRHFLYETNENSRCARVLKSVA